MPYFTDVLLDLWAGGLAILALGLFALQASRASRQARAMVRRQTRRLENLHDIDLAIIAATTTEEIAEAALVRLRALLGVPRASLTLIDPLTAQAEWLAVSGGSPVPARAAFDTRQLGVLEGLQRGEVQFVDVAGRFPEPGRSALLAAGVRRFAMLPMAVRGELIGSLNFGGTSVAFSADQLAMAKEVATQLAIAIQQSRLDARAREASAQYRAIFDNVPLGIAMTAADGRILQGNAALARMLGFATAEEALRWMRGSTEAAYADPEARAEYRRRILRLGTVRDYEVELQRLDGSRFTAVFNGAMVPAVASLEPMAVTIVDDVTRRKAQERRIARLSRVNAMKSGISAATVRVRDRQALLEEACRIAVEDGGVRAAWVGWHDAEAKRLRPVAHAGQFDGFLELVDLSTERGPAEPESTAVQVLLDGAPRATNDLRASLRHAFREEAVARGFLSMMHLPLKAGGATQGVMVLYAGEVGFFDAEEAGLLEALAADVSFALESLEKSQKLDYLAYYDPLTGLPNRALFHDRLAHSLRPRGGDPTVIAVALLDLERFRRVNETLGRAQGDAVLREVGARLRKHSDSAARLGADMFGLVLRGARNAAEVNRALEAVVAAAFTLPVWAGQDDLLVSCRAGVALYPADGVDADALLRNAEAALRRSKRSGEHIVFYAPEMNAQVADALNIENRLRRALERREFVLHYQPKIALAGGQVVGAEALMRWQDPERGAVPPGHFIPILEETGLIIEVGRWALGQAYADLNGWARQGLRPGRVAVNVSSFQLQRKDFVDVVIEEVANGGDHPEWLELEITESLVMRNVEESTRKLSILRGMGVCIAIDDFGTGYSSLSYLSRLPLDALKIDRSFISSMAERGDATTLVTTIITLAHGLGLKVIAEGVETEDQARLLRLFRCDHAQGYLYGRPMPAAGFADLLRAA